MTPPASDPDDLFAADEPFALFGRWLAEAQASEPNDPSAMCLATVDESGLPDARMVLLKGMDARGFVFYTNTLSAKGGQLATSGKAALLFHWKSLRRQVRVRGGVERATAQEADSYFATRHRDSQIGAWASDQSRPLPDRSTLEQRVAEIARRFEGEPVPRPPHWSGYRVIPQRIEFWRDGAFRLHDRRLFERDGQGWRSERLYP